MFIQSILATVFTSAVIAAPAPAIERRAAGDSFSLIALHSTSAVHLQALNANGEAFYVGRNTTTYCPSGVTCPPGIQTVLTVSQDGSSLAMDTTVPGGQTVYIDKFGVLRFTVAHSGGVTPAGAVLDGWTYTPAASGEVVGSLTHGTDEILACTAGNEGYLIFVKIGDVSIPEDCISIDLGTSSFQGFAAWEYE